MTEVFKSEKFQVLFYILLIFIISFLSFWRAFSFDFWGEDWEQLWFAVFDPAMINNPMEMQHPIVIYEELILAKFFQFNTYYWQIVGFLLKILSAISVGIMMWGLTKSKKATFLTGLIYASSVGGLASFTWVAAHSSALVIPFLCLGIYFWVSRKNFVLALALLIFSVWSDPARGFFGSLVIILWEILSILQNPRILNESIKRTSILVVSLITLFLILQYFYYSSSVSLTYSLSLVFANPFKSLNNFLTNIGNLLIGWVIPISQNTFAISSDNIYGRLAGYLFLFQTIYLILQFFKKRSESLKILLIFSLWIPLFFLPNWLLPNQEMIGNGQVLGMTHRYLTLSAVGLVCFLGYILTKVKKNPLQFLLLLLIVVSNILTSNQILERQSDYRSTAVTKPIWDKIEKDVPRGEENSIFFIQGEDKTSVNDISQAKIPFAIRRGIKSRDMWPASTSDPGVVKRYLCGNNEDNRTIPLSHLHAWNIRGNIVDNISEKVREEFREVDCSSIH